MQTHLAIPAVWRSPRTTLGPLPAIGAVIGIVAALFVTLLVLHEAQSVDVRAMVRDPAESDLIPEYSGVYTYLGVLLLWTAGIIGVGAGLIVRDRRAEPGAWRFVLAIGAFCCWLAADDLFMIHEWMGLVLSRLIGVDNEYLGRTSLEGVVFASYGLVALVWMIRHRATILRTQAIFLLLAVGCLGLSAAVDLAASVLPDGIPGGQTGDTVRAYAEEALKLAGILYLAVYVTRVARPMLAKALEPQTATV